MRTFIIPAEIQIAGLAAMTAEPFSEKPAEL